jgi:hypothetical protein
MMDSYKKNKLERMPLFFRNDDIEWCVKGSRWKWVKSGPKVPNISPVKLGTDFMKTEILALENAGFRLPQRVVIFPKRLF